MFTGIITDLGRVRAVEPGAEGVHDGAGGMEAFGAAAQDDGVARLQTQAPGIGGHIGARFIDHADDPKGHAHAGDIQAVGPLPPGHDRAHRIGKPGDVLQTAGHGLDALVIERQPVEQGLAQPPSPARLHVLAVGGEDRVGGPNRCEAARSVGHPGSFPL